MNEIEPKQLIETEIVESAIAMKSIPTPTERTASLVEQEDEQEVFVAASTLEEMNLAQAKLITWAGKKIQKFEDEVKAAQENLDIAKKRKWAQEPFRRIVSSAQRKVEFYVKVKAALEAGYTIIPDVPMDIFAIRTTRKTPKHNSTSGLAQYGTPRVRDQESNTPPLGEGRYLSPQAFVETSEFNKTGSDGKPVKYINVRASEFESEIDFPFKMAKPSVLNATAKALGQKFFDELGAAPSRNQGRRGDPMVIGRIFTGSGVHQKGISFLVSWFIDSKDL